MENTFIYLIGLPGVGKLTIARELAKATGGRLLDNHKINNLVLELFLEDDWKTIPEDCWTHTGKIRKILMDVILNSPSRKISYILTNVLLEGEVEDRSIFEDWKTLILKRGGLLIPVVLTCDPEVHMKRLASPERAKNYKMTDPELLRKRLSAGEKPYRPEDKNILELDVTNISPEESCKIIIEHIKNL
jgi:shikimate kinase